MDTPRTAPPTPRDARTPAADGRPAAPDGPPPAAAEAARGRRRWPRRRLAWAGGLAAAAVALALLLRPSPVEVEVAPVVSGPLEVTVDATGRTRVRDPYQVAAPVAGRLSRIALREGDRVEAGTVIARIRAAPLDVQSASEARARLAAAEAAVGEAGARLTQAGAALDQAARTAERLRVVQEAGGVSREVWERAVLERETARRERDAADARLRAAGVEAAAARRALAMAEGGAAAAVPVRAPVSGRVLRVHERSERVVAPGTPLVDLAQTERLEVEVEVLSTDAVHVRPGATMYVVDWGGAPLAARVARVEPAAFTKVSALGVEEQRVRVIGELPEPAPGLGDGYRVETRIVTWSAPRVLKAPTAALFRTADGWAAYVVEGGRARLREVRVGHREMDEAEVTAGLREGEPVVLFPPDRVEDGARVHARAAGQEGG